MRKGEETGGSETRPRSGERYRLAWRLAGALLVLALLAAGLLARGTGAPGGALASSPSPTPGLSALVCPNCTLGEIQALGGKHQQIFRGAYWAGGHFKGALFMTDTHLPLVLRGADLHGSALMGADLDDVELTGANLRWTNLDHAMLGCIPATSLAAKNCVDARFADLSHNNLHDANLIGARLQDADLTDSVLENAHLNNAYLDGANLSGADLIGAHLNGAHLAGVNLTGVNLSGAYLNGIVGKIANSTVLDSIIFKNTTCPNGQKSDTQPGKVCDLPHEAYPGYKPPIGTLSGGPPYPQ